MDSKHRVDSMNPDDDLAVVEAALHNPRAFAPLYERYFPIIHGYCLRRLSSPEVAADATSQIFINAIQALPKFKPNTTRPGSSFRSWLLTIAHNVVVDTYRRSRLHLSLDVARGEEAALIDLLSDTDPTPEELAIASDSHAYLGTLLNTLPERQRAVAELRFAGLTNAEIAGALNISSPAVRSAQHRAFLALRKLLDGTCNPTGDRS
ncbi:MAG: RNA polymerase sigma factor [Thermomicrobiales bacterium]